MQMFRVALLQMVSGQSPEENRQKGLSFCRQAKEMGADLALFPEMWSTGYTMGTSAEEMRRLAIDKDSAFVRSFQQAARELDMAVGITYLEQYDPLPRNSLTVFDRFGEEVLTYAKVHTCDFDVERNLTPGEDFYTGNLRTKTGEVKIGAMICYDREFPESARILMLKGAELILTPNACPMEINRLSQLRGRAYENMTAIATCNYPSPHPDCNGHSTVFDGVAYLPELSGSRNTCILEAGEDEGIYLAELDMDMLREYRKREVHGNAYRRPEKYGILTETAIREPFIRADRRKECSETVHNNEKV